MNVSRHLLEGSTLLTRKWSGAHPGNRDATVPSVLLHTRGDSQDKQSSAEVTSQNQPQVKYPWSVKSVGLWNHFSGKQPDMPSAVTMTLPSTHLYWYFPYNLYRKPTQLYKYFPYQLYRYFPYNLYRKPTQLYRYFQKEVRARVYQDDHKFHHSPKLSRLDVYHFVGRWGIYVHTMEYYLEIGTYDMLMTGGENKSEMIVYSLSTLIYMKCVTRSECTLGRTRRFGLGKSHLAFWYSFLIDEM